MKKLLVLICFITALSCNKEPLVEMPQQGLEEKSVFTPSDMHDAKSKESLKGLSSSFMCTADPDDYDDCEVTFKIICIDDCGRDLLENGSVFLEFTYHAFFAAGAPIYAATHTNTWNNSPMNPDRLEIGREYTLERRVLASTACPMFVKAELWDGFTAVSGIIYLEINGHIYYPIKTWDIPLCTETTNPNLNPIAITLDEECYPSGRVDFPWDPCDNNSF